MGCELSSSHIKYVNQEEGMRTYSIKHCSHTYYTQSFMNLFFNLIKFQATQKTWVVCPIGWVQ